MTTPRCPRCEAPIPPWLDTDVVCPECGRVHPVVGGVLDLVDDVPGYPVAADRALAAELAALADTATFEEMLRHYWRAQPDVREALVERFVCGDMLGVERAREVRSQIEAEAGSTLSSPCLEVGGGTGALGVALAETGMPVVITDLSLAWLVLARQRLAGFEQPLEVTVIACGGDRLPFDDGAFGTVVAADVIEHVPDAVSFARDLRRVVAPGGVLWMSTPNRLSVTPEPHVQLLGVGWLPRPLALRYVKRFRDVDYSDIRTLSVRGLRKTLAQSVSSSDRVEVVAPQIAAAVRDGYSPLAARIIDVYNRVAAQPALGRALLTITPLVHAVVRVAR